MMSAVYVKGFLLLLLLKWNILLTTTATATTTTTTAFTLSVGSSDVTNKNGNVPNCKYLYQNLECIPTIPTNTNVVSSRRNLLLSTVPVTVTKTAALFGLSLLSLQKPAYAESTSTTKIYTTDTGIKYAILKPADEKRTPFKNDIVAVEYTGYLSNGVIFDSTHAEGKKNALVFQVGSPNVIDGLNEIVQVMGVGEKVQAIIPPQLAFGDKGICLESGECLVQPKSTLVYDIFLKRSAIPPP